MYTYVYIYIYIYVPPHPITGTGSCNEHKAPRCTQATVSAPLTNLRTNERKKKSSTSSNGDNDIPQTKRIMSVTSAICRRRIGKKG